MWEWGWAWGSWGGATLHISDKGPKVWVGCCVCKEFLSSLHPAAVLRTWRNRICQKPAEFEANGGWVALEGTGYVGAGSIQGSEAPPPVETPLLYTTQSAENSCGQPRGSPNSQGLRGQGRITSPEPIAETPVLNWACVEMHDCCGHVASGDHSERLSCGSNTWTLHRYSLQEQSKLTHDPLP